MPEPAHQKYLQRILLDADTIRERTAELGAQISADYEGRDLLLVCLLKGGVLFLCDLMRFITVAHSIEFMAVSSYDLGDRASSGHVRILMDLAVDVEGKDVLIVEDIIDSGHTLSYITRQLKARNPNSLSICTLLSKPSRREIDVPVQYLGFEIPNEYVFGYGLDLDEKFRNLPFVAVADLDVLAEEAPGSTSA